MQDEEKELIEALNGFRKSVQQFQAAVNQIDATMAASIQAADSFASRMEWVTQNINQR